NTNALRWYAYFVEGDVQEYMRTCREIAKYDPDEYVRLGEYCVDHKMETEAVEAFQAGIDKGANAIMVANSSTWLVNYYYDHGQKDHAVAIAKNAAEVYSARGLSTMAELQERMDNLDEAESYFEKIEERYDDSSLLMAFYQRQATSHPDSKFAAKFK